MFDRKHYVPILKTKGGECHALQHLEFKSLSQITPLLEIHGPNKRKDLPPKPIEKHIPDVCQSVEKTWGIWGKTNQCFVDTEWVNKFRGAKWALNTVLESFRDKELKAVPVATIDHTESELGAIKEAMKIDKLGCMLRLGFENADSHKMIDRVLKFLGAERGEVHLLLDYKDNPMNLAEDVAKLPAINEWLTFSAASAAFKKRISDLPMQTWHKMDRSDWSSWQEPVSEGKLARNPTFSDYGTRPCGRPAGGGNPAVHLRYTKSDNWLFFMDGTWQDGDAENIRSICRKLIDRPDFDGKHFSRGDWDIDYMAHQETGSKTPQHWVFWCLSHHFEFVARQLRGKSGT